MIAGIVPASGASSRMGSPKALLDAGGRSFLERVVGALATGGCSPVLVVVRDARSPVAAMARKVGAEVVENPDPSEGPIGSLRRALEALSAGDTDACVLHPVDHPLVRGETVAALVRAFREASASTAPTPKAEASASMAPADPPPIVVPTLDGKRGHPVLFSARVFPELMEDGLEEGARTVVHRHLDSLLEVPVRDEGILVDIDTLPEYRRRFPDAYRKRFQSR
ncbi:MAG: nucleotidyltransferase family protein [Gemmatimonadota bacterium]